ncbi:hypothetical protein AYI69_g9595 [Smittium culicis]|uniref:Uncharacterized protein n=1 Tax=Smittium culicis TaxID=133412 RepID=A0A1R1XBN8_9FUNG|nr:hypothetical protein AYI69_g9595 [Smittium culicis]
MVIRKPIKRARMLFSDAVKSDDHDMTSNEVYNHATERVEDSINWTYHTRHDDQIAKATYFIFDTIEDVSKFMSLALVYSNKQIDMYQKVKPKEDIIVINAPNYRDVGIL